MYPRLDLVARIALFFALVGVPLGVLIFTALVLGSCASGPDLTIYPEQELVYQRLKFREGYEGKLTYSVCLAKDASSGACTSEKIKPYDLSDPKVRDAFNEMGFICKVGEERGKVCQDSAGICSITTTQDCIFPWCAKHEVVAKRWDATADFPFLLGAATRCYQAQKYPFSP